MLPRLSVQRRIAEILRTWNKAFEKTEQVISAKEAALLGYMHAATRDAELEALGEGWVRALLGDVTDVAARRVEWDEAATYRRITVRRACGGLSLRGDAFGSEILTKDMYLVKAGDFVVSRRQVIHGAWAMAREEFDNTHVSKEYACLTARPGRLWMPYLDWLSRTPRLRHEALRCSYGVDPEKMVLNLDWLLKTPLALPATIERQRKLAELLDCAHAEITLLKKQRDALARQKRGLMQKLLTGEWPVTVPESREAAE
jgi:type I restriction enzyme S subunit